jgi:hypothetical protein
LGEVLGGRLLVKTPTMIEGHESVALTPFYFTDGWFHARRSRPPRGRLLVLDGCV